MIIRNLDIHYIRSYKECTVNFSDGLNVLKGKSDAGKSAMIKALMFTIKNKVTKNTFTKRWKGESYARISDGKNAVTRLKKGVKNFYILEGSITAKLEALNRKVPPDVQKILNLGDANIQEQRDTFFLIDKGAGAVSRELNKVAGLSEVDRTIKSITKAINTLNAQVLSMNNIIEEDKEKIEDNKWALEADKELTVAEDMEDSINILDDEIMEIDDLQNDFLKIKNQISEFLPDSVLTDYIQFSTARKKVHEKNNEIKDIEELFENFLDTKKKHDDFVVIDLTELRELKSILETLCDSESDLQQSLDTHDTLSAKLTTIETQLSETVSKIKEIPLCPKCLRPL